MKTIRFIAAVAALLAASAAPSAAQDGASGVPAPELSGQYVYFEEMVPSGEDGIRLLTRIYLPEGDGPFPVVVTRTPYVWGTGDYIEAGREYARRGIGYIQQDCRGKGGSEGFFSPNVNERADGIALYEWLAEQPWCGDIGIFGSSYTALTGWLVGDSIPDKVKGMYLSHYGVDRHISCFRSGLFREDIMSGWAIDNAEEDIVKPERKPGQAPGENYYDFYLYRPQVEADVNVLGQKLQYYRDWITHTDYTDPYWNTGVWADLKRIPYVIDVPLTIVAGQFDHHEEGTVLGYERLRPEIKAKSRLILGSWNHSFQVTPTHVPTANAMEFDINADQFEWFYSLLVKKEEPRGEVRVYNIEADEWVNLDSWPIETASDRTMYLSSETAGDRWNVLALKTSEPQASSVSYVYDPENPVYAEGGETLFTSSGRRGSLRQSPAGYRDDILSFVSGQLEEDMTIAGNVKVYLKVRTDADDTAFAFTLSEVTPSGEAYNMRTSIATLGYRDGLLKPRVEYRRGSTVVLEIEALPIMWTVKAGNSLRLDIKSSQFPEYAVHSNTAGVWAEQARTVVARQTVFVGGEDGSRVVFPVLK
ncbi:MAG TPA: CocE/NonD family hydrolase [Candidatus Cryptobacteroides excrementigallinarum]|nr:CocE/NonD family hydrolase [Candidatus Cryptobacteroides excrementigallinarum]